MSKRPLVSIITPTFNHERYIGACIESMLNQTYENWEMIIINDGSSDGTGDIAQSYDDPRIQYVEQENQGIPNLAKTINRGLSMASGELVTMFSGDDMWPENRLELQVPLFEDDNVVLAFGKGVLIDSDGRKISDVRNRRWPAVTNRPVGSMLGPMLASNVVLQYTVLLRRSALERIGGYVQPEGLLAEDYPTHLYLAMEGEWRYQHEPLGYYRIHPDQHTYNFSIQDAATDMPWVMEFFRALPPGMKEISGWTEEQLAAVHEARVKNAYFEAGRKLLLSRKRGEANRAFRHAFRIGGPKLKAKAAVGLGCSILHVDLERVTRLVGRTPMR